MRFLNLLLFRAKYALEFLLLKLERENNSSRQFLYPTSPENFTSLICNQSWLPDIYSRTSPIPGKSHLNYPTPVSIASFWKSNCISMFVKNGFVADGIFTNKNIDSQKESCRRSTSYGIAM